MLEWKLLVHGSANLIGTSSLKQSINPVDLAGKKVFTFDVETTGVFQGSQVRSMAIAENVDGNVRLLDDFNLTFKSPQLGGVTIGGKESLNDFFARVSSGTKVIEDSRGGKNFLDESAKFVNKLLEADHVAGHNVMFDLQALANTIQQQAGFSNHTAAQEALSKLHEKMAANENFIVDTLEQSRVYLSKQVSNIVETESARLGLDDAGRLNKFTELMYSPEFLARAQIGKGAATASVEAVAMNTNLLQLIEKEAAGGSDQATKLLTDLYKGTHIADTDAILQSYVGKYINQGIRDESDPFALKVVTRAERSGFSDLVKGAQSRIFRASAINATTSIADITHLSDTVLDYVQTKGMSGVQITSTAAELRSAGLIDDIPTGFTDDVMGIMGFEEGTGKAFVRFGDLGPKYLESEAANNYIGRILRESLSEPTEVVNLRKVDGTIVDLGVRVNTSAQKILNLGINYQQASQIDEVSHVARHISTMRPLIDGTKAIDEERLLNSVGKTYELLSKGVPLFEGMKGEGTFPSGLANATADTALRLGQAAVDMGSPHKILSNQSRMFSTIVSKSTTGNLEAARAIAIEMSADTKFDAATASKFADEAEYLRYAKMKDFIPEYGVSHFITQKQMKIVSPVGESAAELVPSRLFVPQQVLQAALGDNILEQGDFSLSVAKVSKKDQLNVFWHAGREEGSKTSREIAESLYKFIMGKNEITNSNKAVEATIRTSLEETKASIDAVQLTEKVKGEDELIDIIAKRIDEGGIGVAYAGEEQTQEFIKQARRAGIQFENDTMIRSMRARFVKSVGDFQTMILSAFEDESVLRASSEAGQDMVDATAKLKSGALGEVSDAISNTSKRTQALLKLRHKRRMIGMGTSDFVETLITQKGNIKAAAIGAAVAGIGYYAYRRGRQNDIYDETLEQQPTEGYSGKINSSDSEPQRINSFRRDPLVTAGVVGNLDRNKIGHHRMGNDKYNHLYSGA